MDYSTLIGNSFEYAKDGLVKNIATWIILILLTVLPVIPFILVLILMLPSLMTGAMPDIPTLVGGFVVAFLLAIILSAFYMGYLLRILRGEVPLPVVSGFGRLFTDGIKYIVIEIIYFLPVLIILALTAGAAILSALPIITAMSGEPDLNALLPIIGGVVAGVLIAVIVAFILGLFAIIGLVRFARTGKMGEAFNFSAIFATIGNIGWGTYIVALIIMAVLVAIVQLIVGLIPFIGGFVQLLIAPFISVFVARYLCMVYDSAVDTVVPSSITTP
ncbi:MAG: DUF4013 domain-containing protein [Methanolinea sp.]|nr:DUF4013 domain-containing protein [Methanolinea sp.]